MDTHDGVNTLLARLSTLLVKLIDKYYVLKFVYISVIVLILGICGVVLLLNVFSSWYHTTFHDNVAV